MRSRRERSRLLCWCVPAVAIALTATAASPADEIAWINAAGGIYQNPNNWTGGVPGSGDDALFDTPAEYAVTFLADHPTRQALFRSGEVTFDMATFVYSLGLGLDVSGQIDGTGPVLTVAGGTLSSGESRVGAGPDAFGRLVVTGAETSWQLSSRLTVGEFGVGEASFDGDATTVINDSLVIAAQPKSTGAVTLDGSGTSISSPALFVGQLGFGTMCITGGASFSAPFGFGWIGNLAGSSGSVVVSGAGSSFVSELLFVGDQGSGSLVIEQEGCATLTANELTMADEPGSDAEIAVVDAGSRCDVDGRIWLFGESIIRVEAAGEMDVASIVSALPVADTVAALVVDGPGSVFASNTLSLGGDEGQATLDITGGGLIDNNNDADVRGNGRAVVTGTGSLWDCRDLSCGDSAGPTACIEIRGGGAASSLRDGLIATQANYRGAITITGAGSRWDVNRNLFVGGDPAARGAPGEGTLAVNDGAVVAVNGAYQQRAGGVLAVGLAPGSPVQVQVSGEATLEGTLRIGLADGFHPSFGSTFDVLTATVVQGGFTTIVQPAHVTFEVMDEPGVVRLRVISPFGDLDGDGTVGFQDLLAVLGTWGDCPDPPEECPADLNDDGVVSFGDLVLLLASWG